MILFKVIIVTVLLLVCQCQGRPHNNEQSQQQPVLAHIEIEKQRLVRFPDVHSPQSEAQTKQILLEIDRINHNLGYVKKQPPTPPMVRPPVESYFFPRDRRHYSPSAAAASSGYQQYPGYSPSFLIIPYPFQLQTFYSPPSPYWEQSEREGRKLGYFPKMDFFRNIFRPFNQLQESKQFDSENVSPPLIQFPGELRNNFTTALPTTTTPRPTTKDPDLIDAIIDEVVDDDDTAEDDDDEEEEDDDDDEDEAEPTPEKKKKVKNDAPNISIDKYINNLYKNSLVVPKVPPGLTSSSSSSSGKITTPLVGFIGNNDQYGTTTENTRIFNPIKRIKEFQKRKKQQQQGQDKESVVSQEQTNNAAKSPFDIFRPAQTALKEGGIVIQRLRVRQGGIAIAGPGGVATAGSGGTAIVGPGGIALTHPRSLAIAGPGARVFSVPENVDLQMIAEQQLKQQKNNKTGRSLPYIEGATIVATGPVVYYNSGMR